MSDSNKLVGKVGNNGQIGRPPKVAQPAKRRGGKARLT